MPMAQSSFTDSTPVRYWVHIRDDIEHHVYKGGEEFLIVEEDTLFDFEDPGVGHLYLYGWRDGVQPAIGGPTVLFPHQVERIDREAEDG